MTNTAILPNDTTLNATPRIALFISNADILHELEIILREKYSSLLVVTDRAKLIEFQTPLLIVMDTIHEVALMKDAHPVEGTQVLIVTPERDSESTAAAFDVGASDYLGYPFVATDVIEKMERYIEAFRATAK